MTARDQFPSLGPGALEEARSLIGIELRRAQHRWNAEAAPDSVRHYCWGIGDDNPLYCDPDYGASTRWKTGLAPGCYLFTVDNAVVAPKLRGIQWMYAGVEFEFHRPLRHRDRFTTRVKLLDAVEKQGVKLAKFIIQTGEVLYYNQHDELVARAIGSTFRIPRARAEGGLKYEPRAPHRYSAEELDRIARDIDAEEVRGATPRYWDDVTVGDALRPVVKGPLNVTDIVCWYSGGGHTYHAHERAHRYRQRHPADAYVDGRTGAQDSPARGHSDEGMARDVGMPGGYDIGPQRISWVGHLLTNWAGDDGFVRKLAVQVRRPNVMGDVSWCCGSVVGKRIEDGARLVDVEVRIENQLDDVTAKGTAVVELPWSGQAGYARA